MIKNKYNYYIIVCIAIILGNLFSQNNSISGWVIDYETNKPIKDVSIYIKQSNLRTSSDDEGFLIYTYVQNAIFLLMSKMI